jgi:hypothetical protein
MKGRRHSTGRLLRVRVAQNGNAGHICRRSPYPCSCGRDLLPITWASFPDASGFLAMLAIHHRWLASRPGTHRFVATSVVAALVPFPLLVGGAIYLGLRTDDLLMFRVVERAGMDGLVASYRSAVAPLGAALPEWVVFSLPNALWSLSLVSLFGLLWRHEQRMAVAAMTGASLLAILPEILQAVHVVPGTYSGQDLLAGLIACCLAALAVHLLSLPSLRRYS